jgi:hypothetical protein
MVSHTFGSRAEVWHGTAKKTSGGLTKKHLMMNKHGRIVSRKKHFSAKKEKRLVKAGYITRKGHFGFIKKDSIKRSKRSSKKKRGGGMGSLHPAPYNGAGVQSSGSALQIFATNV